jgi:metal-responsive CopG/Arc/MetJ family transcriptional regulator
MTQQPRSYGTFAAFRMPEQLREAVDAYCEQQDMTRSQFLRRSILNYLKQQNVDFVIERKLPAKPKQERLSFAQFVKQREEADKNKDDEREER